MGALRGLAVGVSAFAQSDFFATNHAAIRRDDLARLGGYFIRDKRVTLSL